MRADERAVAALDADVRRPTRERSATTLRFSHCAVPLGYVPSTGSALTGSSSPRPAIIRAVTSRTKAGACVGDERAAVAACVG